MPVLKIKKDGVWQDIMGAEKLAIDADTLDGKHASYFATATDVKDLKIKVGDTSVSEQISAAIADIPAIEVPVTSVNGMTGDVAIDIPSVDGLATEEYVDSAVTNIRIVVDSELSIESENPVQNKIVNAAISNLNTLIGDKSVSEQIEAAIAEIPATEIPVTSVNGQIGDVTIEIPEGFSGSWDDLTDKPFGEEGSGGIVEWGDNLLEHIENRDFMHINNNGSAMELYKVSDLTPSAADLTGGILIHGTHASLREMTITEDKLLLGNGCLLFGGYAGESFIVIYNTECSYDGMTFIEVPSTGIYFEYSYITETAWIGAKSLTWGNVTTHQLDEKYIPDTIARIEDIPEVNYPVTSVNGMTGDVVIEVGSGGGILIVNVAANEDGTFFADKTYEEIRAVYESGKVVQLIDPWNDVCQLVYFDDTVFMFARTATYYDYDVNNVQVWSYTWRITSENVCTLENQVTKENRLVITLTSIEYDDEYNEYYCTASHSGIELMNAVNSGCEVVVKIDSPASDSVRYIPFLGIMSGTRYEFGIVEAENMIRYGAFYDTRDEEWIYMEEEYKIPVGGEELGGVKNGGNVIINEDGTMSVDVPSTEGLATETYVNDAIANINRYYTKEEIDNMELITVDDIDEICAQTIQVASPTNVTF